MPTNLRVKVNGRWYAVEVGDLNASPVRVLVDGNPVDVDIEQLDALENLEQAQPEPAPRQPIGSPSVVKVFYTPMPGIIVSIAVSEGDQVVTGDEICKLEAMKMQQSLRADWSGVVKKLHVSAGQHVREGDPIAELE